MHEEEVVEIKGSIVFNLSLPEIKFSQAILVSFNSWDLRREDWWGFNFEIKFPDNRSVLVCFSKFEFWKNKTRWGLGWGPAWGRANGSGPPSKHGYR